MAHEGLCVHARVCVPQRTQQSVCGGGAREQWVIMVGVECGERATAAAVEVVAATRDDPSLPPSLRPMHPPPPHCRVCVRTRTITHLIIMPLPQQPGPCPGPHVSFHVSRNPDLAHADMREREVHTQSCPSTNVSACAPACVCNVSACECVRARARACVCLFSRSRATTRGKLSSTSRSSGLKPRYASCMSE